MVKVVTNCINKKSVYKVWMLEMILLYHLSFISFSCRLNPIYLHVFVSVDLLFHFLEFETTTILEFHFKNVCLTIIQQINLILITDESTDGRLQYHHRITVLHHRVGALGRRVRMFCVRRACYRLTRRQVA